MKAIQTTISRSKLGRHVVLLFIFLIFGVVKVVPQENTGRIQGKVTRPDSLEGIPSVQITLVGPSPAATNAPLSGLYTPNPALTPAMREQVDALIASAPPGITPDVVANAAARMEAQLLGLALPPGALGAPPPQVSAVTDASGQFNISNVAPGRYQVRAQREGYFGTPPRGGVGVGAPTVVTTVVTVVAGQPTPDANITLIRGATVAGKVRDPNGQPASGLQISAFQVAYQNGRATLQSLNSKTTDDRGEFRLFWLGPGEYYIGAIPRRAGPVANPQDTQARTFFPGTIDASTATRVTVTEGGEISGIDFGIRGDATGKISGKIITSIAGINGQLPLASTFFLLSRESEALTDTVAPNFPNTAADRSNGQFEIRGVLPGSYDLVTTIPIQTGGTALGRTRVNVGAGGVVENANLNVQPGIEVKARLILDTGPVAYTMTTPPVSRGGTIISTVNGVVSVANPATNPGAPAAAQVPTPSIRVTLVSLESYAAPFTSAASQNITFDPSGVFVFPHVPEGRYFVQVAPVPANGYIADVRVGSKSVFDEGFDVGNLPGEIQVNVNSKGARIQGSVLDAEQKPFASARLALVPSLARRKNIALYKTVSADDKGNFTINGVAPGEYKLFAWENVQNNAWMNAEFLTQYESRGQTVTVTEGGTVSANVKVISNSAPAR